MARFVFWRWVRASKRQRRQQEQLARSRRQVLRELEAPARDNVPPALLQVAPRLSGLGRRHARREPRFDASPRWRAEMAALRDGDAEAALERLRLLNEHPPAPVAARLLRALSGPRVRSRTTALRVEGAEDAQRYLCALLEARADALRPRDLAIAAQGALYAAADAPGLQAALEARAREWLPQVLRLNEAVALAAQLAHSSPRCAFMRHLDAAAVRLVAGHPRSLRPPGALVSQLCRAALVAGLPLEGLLSSSAVWAGAGPDHACWIAAARLRAGVGGDGDDARALLRAAEAPAAAHALLVEALAAGALDGGDVVDLALTLWPAPAQMALAVWLRQAGHARADEALEAALFAAGVARDRGAAAGAAGIAAAARFGCALDDDAVAELWRVGDRSRPGHNNNALATTAAAALAVPTRGPELERRLQRALGRVANQVPRLRAYHVAQAAELLSAAHPPLRRAVWRDSVERSRRYTGEELRRVGLAGCSSP